MPTLIVEDGSKPQNANSYCPVEFADEYHDLMGNTDWTGYSDDQKASALIKATDSIDQLYGDRYVSQRWPGVQSLLWPRYTFVDNNSIIRQNNEIPVELKKAVAVHALNILSGLVDPYAQQSQEKNIKRKRSKVGELETEVEYRTPVTTETFAGYNQVELLLRPILRNKLSTSVSMVR